MLSTAALLPCTDGKAWLGRGANSAKGSQVDACPQERVLGRGKSGGRADDNTETATKRIKT